MNRICLRDLEVHAIEQVLFVALVVKDGKFRRIEKASAVQSAGGNKIPPLLSAVPEVDTEIGGSKTAVRSW